LASFAELLLAKLPVVAFAAVAAGRAKCYYLGCAWEPAQTSATAAAIGQQPV